MQLKDGSLLNQIWWQERGYELPGFDRKGMRIKTKEAPQWLHFGAGNIFRAFPAALQQTLLNQGLSDRGMIVCEGFDCETIDAVYRPYDNLSVLVTFKSNAAVDKTVIGSVAASLRAQETRPEEWAAVRDAFRNPSLQMVSFTITEKGYGLTDGQGAYLPDVSYDFNQFEEMPRNIMGKVARLCHDRYLAGKYPLALVSMDNCSLNGDKLKAAVLVVSQNWLDRGLVEADFLAYLQNPEKVSFPLTMIDKITPRPDAGVADMLAKDGLEDTRIIRTEKGTFTSLFVNAEEKQYLVVEDRFPNGRPPLEAAGVLFTDRDHVNLVEKMKVGTCLNPIHTALAVFGCLLGYQTIHSEMNDPLLRRMAEILGYDEGLKVVESPGIIEPEEFLREVLEVRLPNPFIPDTPQRIATDTSQKLSVRFGETLKAYLCRDDLDSASLSIVPLVFAGWCRYLMGIGDDGKPFDISTDPMLPVLKAQLGAIQLGDRGPFGGMLHPILSNAGIFGVDLYKTALGEKVEKLFARMVTGEGAVRAVLRETVGT